MVQMDTDSLLFGMLLELSVKTQYGSVKDAPSPSSKKAHQSRQCAFCVNRMATSPMANTSGIYQIQPENPFKQPMNVLCDQEYGSGGWTVIQYRFDGSVNFYRGWQEYKNGFGSLESEFWLGLDRIFQLTASKPLELVVLVVDVNGVSTFAKYDHFEIGDDSQGYVLKSVGAYSGTAGDELTDLVGQKFTTLDIDSEIFEICAYTGGWWHKDCFMRSVAC
ncbi:angiopoietin-related protein 2-like [Anopheles ziemanni]|uniref:angiopoietin-related protein 2-like n=1 Tax=Anopheles coustani TaxID=139045 RepID=UPI002657DAAA|nr:angiopoietin-related protein 2-like [Anopheles coustani]XP_058178567.1 angiopoietin-related protein 2-like [Anopheles ziemanni]